MYICFPSEVFWVNGNEFSNPDLHFLSTLNWLLTEKWVTGRKWACTKWESCADSSAHWCMDRGCQLEGAATSVKSLSPNDIENEHV
jgi:hypothetical protein